MPAMIDIAGAWSGVGKMTDNVAPHIPCPAQAYNLVVRWVEAIRPFLDKRFPFIGGESLDQFKWR